MVMIISVVNLARLLLLSLISAFLFLFIKDRAIYFFLKHAGPTFIKLGQLLANRPDLIGENLSSHLDQLQDNLPPFSWQKAKKIIEDDLKKPINQVFSNFDETPVAAASIAQVHKATTLKGDIVAVKVLRPNINKIFKRDIATLRLLGFLVGIFSRYYKAKLINITEVVEDCGSKELDLHFEAAVAGELKDKLKDIKGFYIPKIHWDLSGNRVLVLEWIDGIRFSDREAILNSGFNLKEVARNLVIGYLEQVYVHGIFHADMHLGNLFLMKNGDIGVVDFGITGTIDKNTRIAIARIMIAFLKQDYREVANIHVEAGLVPKNVNLEEFTLSCRIIGESTVGKAVGEVSMAKLLANLLKMTRKYQMQTRPELLLLQKTMMLVEGVGVFLDKDLNMWDIAKPFAEEWAKKNIGFDAKIRDFVLDFINMVKRYKPAN